MITGKSQTIWRIARRSFCRRCPNCGEGRLFSHYLKQVEHCAVCNEAWGHIRADDGPAWLTILVVGHILAPFMLEMIPGSTWPEWMVMTLWPLLALVLIFALLPFAKGLFIGMVWRMQ